MRVPEGKSAGCILWGDIPVSLISMYCVWLQGNQSVTTSLWKPKFRLRRQNHHVRFCICDFSNFLDIKNCVPPSPHPPLPTEHNDRRVLMKSFNVSETSSSMVVVRLSETEETSEIYKIIHVRKISREEYSKCKRKNKSTMIKKHKQHCVLILLL